LERLVDGCKAMILMGIKMMSRKVRSIISTRGLSTHNDVTWIDEVMRIESVAWLMTDLVTIAVDGILDSLTLARKVMHTVLDTLLVTRKTGHVVLNTLHLRKIVISSCWDRESQQLSRVDVLGSIMTRLHANGIHTIHAAMRNLKVSCDGVSSKVVLIELGVLCNRLLGRVTVDRVPRPFHGRGWKVVHPVKSCNKMGCDS